MTRTGPLRAIILLIAAGVAAGTTHPALARAFAVPAAPSIQSVAPFTPFGPPDVCLAEANPAGLNTLFDTEPAGVVGADYQRTTELPNGEILWTFQDAEIRLPDGDTTLVHNIGMVQTGACFDILVGGTPQAPTAWLFADQTEPFRHWYWPMSSTLGADGLVYIHAAEMEEMGTSYLQQVIPRSTAVAAFDIETRTIGFEGGAGDASPALYGWASASDDEWTYLYAHCHRQFGFDPFFNDVFIHDSSCTARITVARVERGDLFGTRWYWTGAGWSTDPSAATPILPTDGRLTNPLDVAHVDGWWLVVVKIDDWWGDTIVIGASHYPTGPFTTIATLPATPKCPVDCTTYYASWIPTVGATGLAIGLSHNRWDGVLSPIYRPTFTAFLPPPATLRIADRCSIGWCD